MFPPPAALQTKIHHPVKVRTTCVSHPTTIRDRRGQNKSQMKNRKTKYTKCRRPCTWFGALSGDAISLVPLDADTPWMNLGLLILPGEFVDESGKDSDRTFDLPRDLLH